ncbi:cytochrome P450 306a1 [Schistocerca serialis cubense]|uniref:cytochrome P450 306a1 n=1 Tax=Schistocerca serialis cubense TaxID=2023355 RepID=UPI00214E0918|nr:cytochrome P450 306a1 [Schistocerca serialis cubense]
MEPWLCAAALVAAVALWLWLRPRTQKTSPPGPRGLPLLGNLLLLDPAAPHESLSALARRYGPIFSLRLGSVPTVVLADARLVRDAFAKDACTGRAPLYLTHGIMKGKGIICAEGALWRDQRKFVASTLRNLGMVKAGPRRERLEALVADSVDYCLQKLEGETVDPLSALQHSVGNVMNALVFGRTYAEDDPVWRWLQHLQEEGTRLIGVAGPLNFLPFLRFLPQQRRNMRFLVEGQRQTHELYSRLAAAHGQDEGDLLGAFLAEGARRRLDAQPGHHFYSDEQRNFLMADMFGAGLDTTLTTLRWFLLMMAAHPDEQELVWEELRALGRRPCLEDCGSLPRLEAAILETQRIRTVVPVGIPHGVLQDMTLGGFHVPKGTMVLPLLWAIHMDPKAWTEPERFNPARFLDDDGHVVRRDNFIPFQTGKRMCVGEELARVVLWLYCGALLQRLRVSAPDAAAGPDLRGVCGITLTPPPQPLRFTPR